MAQATNVAQATNAHIESNSPRDAGRGTWTLVECADRVGRLGQVCDLNQWPPYPCHTRQQPQPANDHRLRGAGSCPRTPGSRRRRPRVHRPV